MLEYLNKIDYKIDGEIYKLTNICESYLLKRLNIDKTFLYKDVIISMYETPESISKMYYGDVKYWWVVMVANKMVNPFTDIPMNNDVLVQYTTGKYGNANAIHHFLDTTINRYCDDVDSKVYQGLIDTNESLPHYIIPVTNLEYESAINQERTRIKIVNPLFITTFEDTFKGLLNNEN